MSAVNQATILGHLGRDPEIRRTQDGRALATFSVATSEKWTDRNSGEKKERTDWHQVVIFSTGLVEIAEKYLRKGSKVYLQGKLQTRKWQAQDGTDRYTTEIVLGSFNSQLVLCDRADRAPAPTAEDVEATSSGAPDAGRRVDMDDEIPF